MFALSNAGQLIVPSPREWRFAWLLAVSPKVMFSATQANIAYTIVFFCSSSSSCFGGVSFAFAFDQYSNICRLRDRGYEWMCVDLSLTLCVCVYVCVCMCVCVCVCVWVSQL